VRQQSVMTFVMTADASGMLNYRIFNGKFMWHINLLCARGDLVYPLDIGSEI
jgi:hypothetical protein